MRDHLIRRGNQFYLRLPVPRPLRRLSLFVSGTSKPKDYIVEPLGPSHDAARVEAIRRAADYRALFDRAALMTREAIQEELVAIKRSADERKRLRENPALLRSEIDRVRQQAVAMEAKAAAIQAELAPRFERIMGLMKDMPAGETISQAAEPWFAELQREGVRPQTLDGHRLRVRAFTEHCGDVPLVSVTRAMASDWLTAVAGGRSNRTVNIYATSLLCLWKHARNRGRVSGENPFADQRRKVTASEREAFSAEEIGKLFAALPVERAPKKHSPETALPWCVRIAAFSGMRLEEIAQLTVRDVQRRGTNGGSVVVFDIHNGDDKHHIKNGSSARAVPIHSALVRAGLLDYGQALPQDGLLFPGLKRRASKGGKIGARIGELFRRALIELGMKREGLCFHSLRHSVAQGLEAAAVSQTDAARILGHAIEGESYGTYSSGPGLLRLAAVVEKIDYRADVE